MHVQDHKADILALSAVGFGAFMLYRAARAFEIARIARITSEDSGAPEEAGISHSNTTDHSLFV